MSAVSPYAASGYSPTVSYNIYYNLLGTYTFLANVLISVNPTNTYTHTGVTAGQTYTYKISAINIFGEGVQSSASPSILASLKPD